MHALIHAGVVVDIAAAQFPVHDDLSWVDISAVSPVPAHGWAYDGTAFTVPALATPAVPLPVQAEAALTASDRTILRCYEHAVPVPAEWTAYRAELRAVISGASTTMPTRPAFPAGT